MARARVEQQQPAATGTTLIVMVGLGIAFCLKALQKGVGGASAAFLKRLEHGLYMLCFELLARD